MAETSDVQVSTYFIAGVHVDAGATKIFRHLLSVACSRSTQKTVILVALQTQIYE